MWLPREKTEMGRAWKVLYTDHLASTRAEGGSAEGGAAVLPTVARGCCARAAAPCAATTPATASTVRAARALLWPRLMREEKKVRGRVTLKATTGTTTARLTSRQGREVEVGLQDRALPRGAHSRSPMAMR